MQEEGIDMYIEDFQGPPSTTKYIHTYLQYVRT
jgi:hypothetical protein